MARLERRRRLLRLRQYEQELRREAEEKMAEVQRAVCVAVLRLLVQRALPQARRPPPSPTRSPPLQLDLSLEDASRQLGELQATKERVLRGFMTGVQERIAKLVAMKRHAEQEVQQGGGWVGRGGWGMGGGRRRGRGRGRGRGRVGAEG